MADDVEVRFGANILGIIAGVNDVKTQIESLADSAASIRSSFAGVGTGLAELFAVDQIANYAGRLSDLGEQAIRMSSMLGMSVEEVQKLGFAAKMTGGDADGMAMGLMRLERNMAEAQSGSGKAYEAFKNLGISLDDLKTKSPDQILGMIADKFASTQDGATKTAYAMDLMGRSGAQMIPIFDQGSAGLEKMGITAQQTGSILTQELAEAFEKTHQNIVVMEASLEGVSVNLFSAFIPAVNAVVNGMSDLSQWFTQAAKSGGSMREIIILIEGAFDGLVMGIESGAVTIKTAIEGVALIFYDLKVSADVVVAAIVDLFVGLGKAIKDALTGNFSAIQSDYDEAINKMKADWAAGMREMSAAADQFADDTISSWAKLQQRANEMWAALWGGGTQTGKPTPKPPLPPAPTGSGSDKTDNSAEQNEIAIEKSDLAEKLEMYKLDEAAKKASDQIKVDSGEMSNAKMLADLKTSLEGEKDAAVAEITAEQALYDEDSAAWEQLQNKKLIVAKQYDNQIAQITLKSAADQKKQYDQLFSGIKSAMDGMVTGILQGTQTIQQAMLRLVDNLGIKFAQLAANKLLDWTKAELQSVTVTQTADAAKVASNTAAAGASDAVGAAHLIKEITSSAAATYAGVFAFLSPELGPLAAVPAGIAAGTVGAMTGLVSLDVGAWNVPQNMPAFLHAGEMVVPQNFASGLRDGGGIGGGDQYSVTIHAVDAQSFANLLQSTAGQRVLVNTIAQQARNGNPKVTNSLRT